MSWNRIHSFGDGFGLYSPGTVTVHEDHPEAAIPYRVQSEDGARYLFAGEVQALLGVDLFSVPEAELDALYERMKAPQEQRAKEMADRMRARGPLRFDRILVPRFTKDVPLMDIREALLSQPLLSEVAPNE